MEHKWKSSYFSCNLQHAQVTTLCQNKKFELMLTRHAKEYSSSGSVV